MTPEHLAEIRKNLSLGNRISSADVSLLVQYIDELLKREKENLPLINSTGIYRRHDREHLPKKRKPNGRPGGYERVFTDDKSYPQEQK